MLAPILFEDVEMLVRVVEHEKLDASRSRLAPCAYRMQGRAWQT